MRGSRHQRLTVTDFFPGFITPPAVSTLQHSRFIAFARVRAKHADIDITTTNGAKYYQLKRAAEDRKRWHGLVVNLAQETTLRSHAAMTI